MQQQTQHPQSPPSALIISQQKQPSSSTPSTSSYQQLSLQYFPKIPQLSIIQQQFEINQIDNTLKLRDIETQFELIRAITQTKKHKMKLRSNNVLENKRNRYPQQSIFQHSRVLINSSNSNSKYGIGNIRVDDNNNNNNQGQIQLKIKHKNNKNNYINANYIHAYQQQNNNNNNKNRIIVTQAPLQQTVVDFINMIIQNQISCVVMLCNVTQNGKNRCYDYLNQSHLYQSVKLNQNNSNNGIQIRKIRIKILNNNNNNNSQQNTQKYHQFQHILFTQWPDKSVPQNPQKIKPILDLCIKHNKIVIHCSAGLGRSGVICVLYQIIRNIQLQKQRQNNNKISIFGQVRKLREYRYGAVQNNQQYRFIYEYLQYYYHSNIKN